MAKTMDEIPATIGEDCKCKRYKCFEVISAAHRVEIFKRFRFDFPMRKSQDQFLASLISMEEIKQRKSKSNRENNNSDEEENARRHEHSAAYYYRLKVPKVVRDKLGSGDEDCVEVPVCRSAFLGILGVSRGRLRSIQVMLYQSQKGPLFDPRVEVLPEPIRILIEAHIDNHVLSETYSVKDMHNNFLNEYKINIPYKMYWYVFYASFKIDKFQPQTIACPTFDTFSEILHLFNGFGDDGCWAPRWDDRNDEVAPLIYRSAFPRFNLVLIAGMISITLITLGDNNVTVFLNLWHPYSIIVICIINNGQNMYFYETFYKIK